MAFCFNSNSTIENLKYQLRHTHFYTESEVYAVQQSQTEFLYELFELWKIGPGEKILDSKIGEWKPTSGLDIIDLTYKYHRRSDFKGYPIKTVRHELTLKCDGIEGNVSHIIILWDYLQEKLNFTQVKIILPPCSFGEVFLSVLNKEADASARTGTVVLREKNDKTWGFRKISHHLIIRRPVARASPNLYILPFTNGVWLITLSFTFGTGFYMWLLNKIAFIHKRRSEWKESVNSSIWNSLCIFLQQGSESDPDSHSGRVVLVVWSFTCLILFTSYSSLIVAYLGTLKPVFPLRTFHDLRYKPDWKLGTLKQNYEALLKESKDPDEYLAWKHNLNPDREYNVVASYKEGLKKALKGKFAFFTPSYGGTLNGMGVLPEEEAEQLVYTDVEYWPVQTCIDLQKNSPFFKIINHYILKMMNTGVMHRHNLRLNFGVPYAPAVDYPRPGIDEVFMAHSFYGAGLLLSLLLLCIENVVSFWKKKVDVK